MSNERTINVPNINLDDIIKLSHIEVLDYLIKRTADDAENLDEFNVDAVAEIISDHYKTLFTKDFLKRYEKVIEDHRSTIRQVTDSL